MIKRTNVIIIASLLLSFSMINCAKRHNPTGSSLDDNSPTATATDIIYTETQTRTITPDATATETQTAQDSCTITKTATPQDTYTYSATPTISETATLSYTYTATQTDTQTVTVTLTGTYTCTATPTATPTDTDTFTATLTFTSTRTATPTPTFTVTPTVTPGLHVKYSLIGLIKAKYKVSIFWIDINATGFTTHLRQNNDLGLPVNGATVNCDGNLPAEGGTSGNYKTYTLSLLYTVGQTASSSIVSGIGSTSASAVVPPAATVSWPTHLTTLNTAINNTVTWSYPAAVPVTVSVIVADSITDINQVYMNQYVPGTSTSYTIPAGMLPAGLNQVYLLVGGANFGAYTGIEPNTNTLSVHNMHGVVINTQ